MNFFSKALAVSAFSAAALALPAQSVSAETLVFDVTNYAPGSGKHGLWTNNTDQGANRFYAFQLGTLFTVDTVTGTATLKGQAINPDNVVADIDLSFGGFLETTLGSGFSYKKQGGNAYDEVADLADVDFFTTGTGTIKLDAYTYSLRADPFAQDTAFQYGEGANAKNGDFGGSAWILVEGQGGERPNHWDLNFNLSAVPEPTTWAMMIIGFGAIGSSLRRKKSKAAMQFA